MYGVEGLPAAAHVAGGQLASLLMPCFYGGRRAFGRERAEWHGLAWGVPLAGEPPRGCGVRVARDGGTPLTRGGASGTGWLGVSRWADEPPRGCGGERHATGRAEWHGLAWGVPLPDKPATRLRGRAARNGERLFASRTVHPGYPERRARAAGAGDSVLRARCDFPPDDRWHLACDRGAGCLSFDIAEQCQNELPPSGTQPVSVARSRKFARASKSVLGTFALQKCRPAQRVSLKYGLGHLKRILQKTAVEEDLGRLSIPCGLPNRPACLLRALTLTESDGYGSAFYP